MSNNVYLKKIQTFTDPAITDKVKVYYRIEYFNHLQLIRHVEAPGVSNPASGNITLIYELQPTTTLPTTAQVTEEFVDAHLTGDWHTFPQPHKVTLILIHDKGFDEGSMNTTDPN